MAEYNIVTVKANGRKALVTAELETTLVNAIIENVPCLSSVYVGAAVIMNGSGTAENGLADSMANSNVIGLVEAKSDATTCTIRVAGVTLDLYTGLDVTKEYFLSDTVAGELTTTVPTTSGHIKVKIGQPFSAETFLFIKGERVVRL